MLQAQSPQNESQAEIKRLIRQLGSRNRTKQEEAERKLLETGPEAIEALLAFLAKEKPKKQERYWATYLIVMFIATAFWMTILGITGKIKWMSIALAFAGFYPGLAGVLSVTRQQKRAAQLLAKCEDVRAVGPLLDARFYMNRKTAQAAVAALIRLLPRVKAEDGALLDAGQREYLLGILRGSKVELILAALKALEQIGDASALPNVKRLAAGKGIAAKDFRIREAAQACLPFLQERSEERSSRTLLRASDALTSPPGTLLRPAAPAPEANPQQLLRAAGSEDA